MESLLLILVYLRSFLFPLEIRGLDPIMRLRESLFWQPICRILEVAPIILMAMSLLSEIMADVWIWY